LDNSNPYLRPQDAAKYIGVCKATLWSYIKAGKLTAHKISSRVTVIEKSELDALVKGAA